MSGTEIQKCPCGRSPLGKCIGLHKLTEEDYRAWLVSQMGPTNAEGEE